MGAYQTQAFPHALGHLVADGLLVGDDFRHRRVRWVVRAQADDAVAVSGGDHGSRPGRAGAEAAPEAAADGRQVAPAGVIAVAAEVFGWHLPVGGNLPLVGAADDLDTALAAVEEYVEIPGGGAEVFQQGRRGRVEGGED